jgi:hypothetical protein
VKEGAGRNGQWLVGMLFVAPLTIGIAGPPMLQGDVAQTECAQLVVQRLGGTPADATAAWVRLPIPHWSCEDSGKEVAQFGWWAMASSSTDAEILLPWWMRSAQQSHRVFIHEYASESHV